MPTTPPRYVPTLTQIVQPPEPSAVAADAPGQEPAVETQSDAQQPQVPQTAEQWLHQQVFSSAQQYLDLELQKRIRETISQLALEHAHKLFEEIQPLLEATISQVVQEAVEQAVRQTSKHGA